MYSPLRRNALVRIAPFATFMLMLALRGALPRDNAWGFDPRWLYVAGVLLVSAQLWLWRREYGELARQNLPEPRELALAAGVGLAVFGLWITLDAPWMRLDDAAASYRPVDREGQLIPLLATFRWIGAALLVPLMEELFWRSFLMRWIERAQFETVDPRHVGLKAIVLSTFVFVLAHTLWLAAAIAGLAYAWLYMRRGRLWTAIAAHAVTNGALGAYVLATGSWQFW